MTASKWVPIKKTKPSAGQVIACKAKHINGGYMYWAGIVTEIRGDIAVMETRGENIRSFIITFDTMWHPLPS